MLNLNSPSKSAYDFLDPFADAASLEEGAFIAELVATQAFQRLREIRFLGGIDYLLVRSPNGCSGNVRYTRYQHSLGVAKLASLYSERLELPQRERRLACAAALLHDIGHAPLSHSLEPIFKALFDLDHHRVTEDVVLGRLDIGGQVREVLEQFGVDPEQVAAVLSGELDPCGGFFSGPINFDTIEGVLRSCRYMGPTQSGLTPHRVLYAAIERSSAEDKDAVDMFWNYKNNIYSLIIRSRDGVYADHVCQAVALKSIATLRQSDYLATEKDIFRKIPDMRKALGLDPASAMERFAIDGFADYICRSFYVDPDGDFFNRADHCRYRQRKSARRVSLMASRQRKVVSLHGDLLDGDNGQ